MSQERPPTGESSHPAHSAAKNSGPGAEIRSLEELRELIGAPSQKILDTVRQELHPLHVAFLGAAPLCFVATSDEHGHCDVSPKGDPPGFARVLDARRIAIPDRPGNRRLDSWTNVLANPHVGLIFVVPGREDTLRINGRARLLKDAPFFDEMTVKGNRPKVVLFVEIQQVYFHCAKAFLRSDCWDASTWNPQAVPRRAAIVQEMDYPEKTVEEMDAHYGPGYLERLYRW